MNISSFEFTISDNYDYTKSSEENYRCDDAPFVDKYQNIRNRLNYTYHYYSLYGTSCLQSGGGERVS